VNIAGAPISWGVSEVPDWGHQLPASRVLSEMRKLGLTGTEFGPEGYLDVTQTAGHGLTAVGAFVPVVLHEHGDDAALDAAIASLTGSDAVLVLAAATGLDGYDTRPTLDAAGWNTLLTNLDRAADRAAAQGYATTVHPHVGTMIERPDEVQRVLDGSQTDLCLDTGHLMIGGTDPADLARRYPDRIGHVHLKDVDGTLAERVRAGDLAYTDAVRQGLYRPLGDGDADIAGVIAALQQYEGWYVIEQDKVLSDASGDPAADVGRSLNYLTSLT
jgi:inosose dehydratase